MITLKHIEKKYDDVTPLRDVNLTINKGDVISVIGPSGTGKSTLLRCIVMLDPPTAGEIYYDGKPVPKKGKELDRIRRKIGMVFQSFNLFENKTVLENIMIPQMDLLGLSKQEAYDISIDILKKVGLKDKALHLPSELSGGQKQRAAICRTVALKPEIILFDEPTSALDPTMVGEVQKVIKGLAEQGTTMMIVTHEMKFAKEVANRVLYMDEGVVYEDGTPEQIFDNPQKEKTRLFMGMLNVLTFDINTDSYDYFGVYSRIEEYGFRNRIPYKSVEHIQAVFEELCGWVLLSEHPGMNLNLKINYLEKEGKTQMLIRYDGEAFNPENTENIVAFKLAMHAADEYSYSEELTDGFTNKIEVTIYNK